MKFLDIPLPRHYNLPFVRVQCILRILLNYFNVGEELCTDQDISENTRRDEEKSEERNAA